MARGPCVTRCFISIDRRSAESQHWPSMRSSGSTRTCSKSPAPITLTTLILLRARRYIERLPSRVPRSSRWSICAEMRTRWSTLYLVLWACTLTTTCSWLMRTLTSLQFRKSIMRYPRSWRYRWWSWLPRLTWLKGPPRKRKRSWSLLWPLLRGSSKSRYFSLTRT